MFLNPTDWSSSSVMTHLPPCCPIIIGQHIAIYKEFLLNDLTISLEPNNYPLGQTLACLHVTKDGARIPSLSSVSKALTPGHWPSCTLSNGALRSWLLQSPFISCGQPPNLVVAPHPQLFPLESLISFFFFFYLLLEGLPKASSSSDTSRNLPSLPELRDLSKHQEAQHRLVQLS